MAIAKITHNTYTVDSLYQWDKNQTLEIHGLSLPSVPEIHYSNSDMDRAIVRQAAMDAAGIITAEIPNSLLQKPYKIAAYICIYQGSTFKSLYKIEIPVNARTKPADYTFEDTAGEAYSFNALENMVANGLYDATEIYNATVTAKNEAEASAKAAAETLENALAEAEEMIPNLVNESGLTSIGYSIAASDSTANKILRSISVPAKHCCIGQMAISSGTAYQSTGPLIEKLYITDSATDGEGTEYINCYSNGAGSALTLTYVLVNDTDSAKTFYVWICRGVSIQPAVHMSTISEIFIPCTSN